MKERLPFMAGKVIRSDAPTLTFYDDKQDPVRIQPGTFVSDDVIRRFGIDSKYFIHPESLRVRGSFEFAAKHKKNFSVGIKRVQFGRGDVLLASVIAKALKYKYGNAVKTYFLIRPGYEPLLNHNPYVDHVFTSEQAYNGAGLDIRFGVDDMEFKTELKEFERNEVITRNRTTIYLDQVGLYLENKTPIYVVTEAEKSWAKRRLEILRYDFSKPIVGISLYGSNLSRTYPRMQEFANSLEKNRGYRVVYLDKKINRKYEYSIRQMGAMISQCDLVISSNTFALHLAGAMRKRAIILFGSCDGSIWTEDYEKITPVQIACPAPRGKRCWWELRCLPGTNLREKENKASPPCLKQIPFKKINGAIDRHFKAKRILVVVLTYNFLNLTKQMIDSIRSFHNYDIFVIDNDSSDNTQKWLERTKVKFISKKMSVPRAWNIGMRKAYEEEYDYVLLCNNDVILAPNYIDSVVSVAERRRAYAVTGRVINKGQASQTKFAEFIKNVEVPVSIMEAGDYSALLLSKECIKRIGRFNERFGPRYQSDEDHLLRLRLSGKGLIKTYFTTFFHLLGAVVRSSSVAQKQHHIEWDRNAKLFKKLWKIHPYNERSLLASLELVKQRNPDWKSRISMPFANLLTWQHADNTEWESERPYKLLEK